MEPQLTRAGLATIQQPVREELDLVLAELGRIIASDFHLIDDVNRYLMGIRGKLFRPMLVLLAGRATGEPRPSDVTLASVVELIHLATLIHDDSVDHSVLRRGRPTVNAMFSHQVAVIMGDYLYSRAIVERVELGDPEPLRVMSRVTNDMTVGEMRELEAHDVLDFSEEAYEALIEAKTASLMAGACEVGAIGREEAFRPPLQRYGRNLGMAFQIVDDILDYIGSEAVTGKPVGLDLREHKITLPLIQALPRMQAGERRVVERLMGDPAPSDEHVADVIDLVDRRGGIDAARGRAHQFALEGEAELLRLPESPAREALRDCLSYAVERQS